MLFQTVYYIFLSYKITRNHLAKFLAEFSFFLFPLTSLATPPEGTIYHEQAFYSLRTTSCLYRPLQGVSTTFLCIEAHLALLS